MSEVREIPVESIKPNPYQARDRGEDEELKELAKSIKEQGGLIQPIVVREKDGFYEIATGERRWRAYRRLGYTSIPAFVRKLTDEKMIEMAPVENLQRKNLNPIEEASGYGKLQEKFGWTQEQVAKRLGKTRDHVAQRLRLLEFPPEIRELVSRDTITPTHAELIASLKDPELIQRAAKAAVDKNLSTRQLESLVKSLLQQKEFRNLIPSLLEFHAEKAQNLWRTCGHAVDDYCMLFGWKEEPADWMERLGGRIEFVKKGDEWHPKGSPYLCSLCNRYLDHRALEMENGLLCLFILVGSVGAYRCKRCDSVDSSGLCILWGYDHFPSSVGSYLEYVSDDGSQRKSIVKQIDGKFHINVKAFPFACALCSSFSSKVE